MAKRVTNATAAAIAAIETAASGLTGTMPADFPRLLFGRSVAEDLEATQIVRTEERSVTGL